MIATEPRRGSGVRSIPTCYSKALKGLPRQPVFAQRCGSTPKTPNNCEVNQAGVYPQVGDFSSIHFTKPVLSVAGSRRRIAKEKQEMTANQQDRYQRDGFIDKADVEHRKRGDQQENSEQEPHDTSNAAQKALRTRRGVASVQNPGDVAPRDHNSYQQSNQL
jgi:hypothetical protein